MIKEVKEIFDKFKSEGRIVSYVFDYRCGDIYINLNKKNEILLNYEKILDYSHKEEFIISEINMAITEKFCELAAISNRFNGKT